MDRNTIIGLTLIFLLFIAWQQFMAPSPEELEAQQRMQDSLARMEQKAVGDSVVNEPLDTAARQAAVELDSAAMARYSSSFGPFAGSATGEEEVLRLENEYLAVSFSSKGGRIQEVLLKKYFKIIEVKGGKDENAYHFSHVYSPVRSIRIHGRSSTGVAMLSPPSGPEEIAPSRRKELKGPVASAETRKLPR